MIRTASIVLFAFCWALLPCTDLVGANYHGVIAAKKRAANPSWVVSEDFETGATTAGWTDTIPPPTWNDTTAGKSGTYCLEISGNGASNDEYTTYTIPDGDYYCAVFRFNAADVTPASDEFIFGLRGTGGTGSPASVVLDNTTGGLILYCNSGFSAVTTDALSDNTWYWVKLVYDATGNSSVEFTTDTGDASPTFLGSGNKYRSRASANETVAQLRIGGLSLPAAAMRYDQVILSSSDISAGSTP